MLLQPELHHQPELALLHRIDAADARDAPGIAHDPVKLTPAHAEQNLVYAGIASDQLEPGVQDGVERNRKHLRVAPRPAGADLKLPAAQDVVKVPRRSGAGNEEAGDFIVHAAVPMEPGGIESCRRAIAVEQRFHCHAAADESDLRSILGCCVVHIVRERH